MVVLKRLIPAVAVLWTLSACSDSLSPDDVNPSTMNASMNSMRGMFDNVAFQSLAELAFLFPDYGAVSALRTALPVVPTASPAAVALLRSRVAASFSRRSDPHALFPANVLGRTLEWNATTHVYEIGNLTGAPANGLRFILYTVSAVTHEPIVTQQLGYVELTDESTAQVDRIGVLLTLGQATVADYTITAQYGTTSQQFETEGFIRSITNDDQVDFDFLLAADSAAHTFLVSSDLSNNNNGAIHVSVDADDLTATLEIGVSQGRNDLTMDIALGLTDEINGTLKYNGTTVATIDGTFDAPIFVGAGGRTLTQQEIGALASVYVRAVEIAADLSDAVMRPGGIVF